MKPIYQSKTLWVNLVLFLSALLAMPELTALLGESTLQYVVVAQSALNVVLRLVTSQPVSMTGTGGT